MRSVSADFCAEAGTAPAPIAAISITPPKVLRIVPPPCRERNNRSDSSQRQEGLAVGMASRGIISAKRRAGSLRDRRVEVAAVENQVVSDDEADLGRAQEGAGIAELGRITDAPGI